jgi:hypothetical protein
MRHLKDARLLDLRHHAAGVVACAGVRFVEGVNGRQAVVEHVEEADHLERAERLAITSRLAELDQARVDAGLRLELGVLVDPVVIQATAWAAFTPEQ